MQRSIIDGKKVACKELIQAAQRFLDDLNDERYEIRHKDAEFCIGIIEKTFVHIKGAAKGQPYILKIGSALLFIIALLFI